MRVISCRLFLSLVLADCSKESVSQKVWQREFEVHCLCLESQGPYKLCWQQSGSDYSGGGWSSTDLPRDFFDETFLAQLRNGDIEIDHDMPPLVDDDWFPVNTPWHPEADISLPWVHSLHQSITDLFVAGPSPFRRSCYMQPLSAS